MKRTAVLAAALAALLASGAIAQQPDVKVFGAQVPMRGGAFVPAGTQLECSALQSGRYWDGKEWHALYPAGTRKHANPTDEEVTCNVIAMETVGRRANVSAAAWTTIWSDRAVSRACVCDEAVEARTVGAWIDVGAAKAGRHASGNSGKSALRGMVKTLGGCDRRQAEHKRAIITASPSSLSSSH